MKQKLGVTTVVPDNVDPLGVYSDENGVEVFETDAPYLLSDGVSRESPMPVRVVDGSVYIDAFGNAMQALAVTGLGPPQPRGITWGNGVTWDNGTYWS